MLLRDLFYDFAWWSLNTGYTVHGGEPFPKRQVLDSSKLKEFAENHFKLDENEGKFSKMIENTTGKGEIAHYEQFLLYPHVF